MVSCQETLLGSVLEGESGGTEGSESPTSIATRPPSGRAGTGRGLGGPEQTDPWELSLLNSCAFAGFAVEDEMLLMEAQPCCAVTGKPGS